MTISIYGNRAEKLAKELVRKVRNGESVNIGAEAIRVGYSLASAKTYKFYNSADFQRIMQENKDIMAKEIEEEKQAIVERMKKTRSKAKYRDLAYSFDIMNKNQRLISGESTENIANKGSIVMLPQAEAEPSDVSVDLNEPKLEQ